MIPAAGVTTYGGPEKLHTVELPEPHPGSGEVRIRVQAAGVNPVDAMMRSGTLAGLYAGVEPPYVPGMEVAGVIDELGDGIHPDLALSLGLRVVAFVDFHGSSGGYSHSVVVPAESAVPAPANLDDAHAAAFLMNALTARNVLDLLSLPAGATLLVTGAAGAVGGYLTELGSAQGLRIIATAGPDDEDLVHGFGAQTFIPRGSDLRSAVHQLAPGGLDAVVDPAGIGPAIIGTVRDGGQVAAFGMAAWPDERGIRIHRPNVRQRSRDTAAITTLRDQAENRTLTVRVADVIPAGRAADAHERLARGGLRGRLVLDTTNFTP